jgi:hypothetical protein
MAVSITTLSISMEGYYAECGRFSVMPNIIMTLSVVLLCAVSLNVIMLNVIWVIVVLMNIAML